MISRPLQCLVSVLLFTVLFSQLSIAQTDAIEAFEKQDYDAAIQVWDQLLLEHPELRGIHYNKGNARFRKGELDEAIGSYEQALGEQDKDALADIYYNLGNAWLYKQDIEKAREFYKQTLKLRPDDQDAKANLELLNHMPPPPQQQQSQQNQDDQEQQESQEQQQEQNSNSEDQNSAQQKQEQEQQQEDQSQQDQKDQQQDSGDEQQEQEQQQNPSQGEEGVDQDELMNAQQLLDALKDRETENLREQIKLKTSGTDQEKDW
ncbi:MAG: tetratricopeptide repeat protein [Candidatus Marinimicrobia bacterium]|nr:tetratricopeptide repeat protein [Candidatus Neomarinimicrobiota bacterium]